MTEENKKKYLEIVNNLRAKDMTNIKQAMELALDQIIERKEINELTSVFLLSDGCDTCGNNLDSIMTLI